MCRYLEHSFGHKYYMEIYLFILISIIFIEKTWCIHKCSKIITKRKRQVLKKREPITFTNECSSLVSRVWDHSNKTLKKEYFNTITEIFTPLIVQLFLSLHRVYIRQCSYFQANDTMITNTTLPSRK